MKRFVFITIMILISELSNGQDFDYLIARRQVDCSDISYNSGLYFVKFMQENKVDSAAHLLNYWETKCGIREPVFRAKILLALEQNEFNDSLLKMGTLNNIFNYQNRMDLIKQSNYYSYDNYTSYFGFIPPGQEFDKFTQDLAKRLTNKYEPGTIEFLIAEFYGENCDTIFSRIQEENFGQSAFIKEYEMAVEGFVNMPEFHISGLTGLWIPTGGIKKLGLHPELGMQFGMKHKKMNYDLILAFKFLNSPNEYYARRTRSGGDLELTDHFFGGHVGFEIGRDIYAKSGHELQFIGGIAYDGFDALNEDLDNNLKSASTGTYNFNFGIGYRYYVSNTHYLGLRVKYNIVDYSLNNVVDFTGNPITVHLVIGGVNNVIRNNNLKALKYKLRK